MRKTLTAVAAMLLTASSLTAETLYFSAIPDEDETALIARFEKVADYLEGALGVDVQFVPVKSYAASVTAFRNDQVQLAWFGGLTGVQARRLSPGAKAIAQGVEDQTFVTYFIANKALGLTPSDTFPEGIEGRTFTFGAKTSTSGRLMPEFHIRQETGKSPEDLFAKVGFSGDHSQTLRLVASGAWDVGALNYSVYDKAEAEGAPQADDAVVIWKTPPYPDYNWTIRGDVDARFGDGFSDKVQAALIGLTDADVLASFPRSGFIPAQDSDYQPIEDVATELGLLE
ncbi:Phosphate-import protein PhnD [Pseudoprimorskyibacter insulae]|uniref:Phosphate-import protein PhnD n=2 Tax=Pseudoprimorskyibacter insulae TaxID=1695997 RepID=A0A2R8B034_9RHOB|nr:Phosphate-import protein PhnD [Pseudoprimorskyibacter insulae]